MLHIPLKTTDSPDQKVQVVYSRHARHPELSVGTDDQERQRKGVQRFSCRVNQRDTGRGGFGDTAWSGLDVCDIDAE